MKNNTSVPKLLEMERTIAETTQQEEFARRAFSAYDTNEPKPDERVNHPKHYQHPSCVECITVARHHDFNIGNALKYIFRAGFKSTTQEQIGKWYKETSIHEKAKEDGVSIAVYSISTLLTQTLAENNEK